MNTPQNNNDNNGCRQPLVYWGSLLLIFLICKGINESDPQLARTLFGIGIISWFLFPVVSFIKGKNFEETKDNLLGCLYIPALLLGAALILGLILPSSCTKIDGPEPTDIYFRR
jgi:hypothetical protein